MRHAVTLSISLASLACQNRGPATEALPRERPLEVVTQIDRIAQLTNSSIDVLFVVDDGSSMGDEHEALRSNFSVFLDFFVGAGLDYHIGLVSTDVDTDAPSPAALYNVDDIRFIEPSLDADEARTAFDGMVQQLGTSGSSRTAGLEAAFLTLEQRAGSVANQGFYRPTAALHLVFVSDRPDRSTLVSPDEWVPWLQGLKGPGQELTASSVVCFPPNRLHEGAPPGACPGSTGEDYLVVSDDVGGITWDITDPNWAELLDRLGMLASSRQTEFFLSQAPVVDTIDVSVLRDVEGELTTLRPPGGFEIEYSAGRNSITFVNFLPRPLDIVEVLYTRRSDRQSDE